MQYDFKWDPVKAASNAHKHGVTFKQAMQVFKDPMALTVYDDEHSEGGEERWITMGQSNGRVYLLVVHTYQDLENDGVIKVRIISARQANKFEIQQYEQG